MLKGRALLFLAAALLYLLLPWDFDFIPVAGRLDDLLVFALAVWYAWKTRAAAPGRGGGSREERGASVEDDPYETLGVGREAAEEEIKRAYRELLNKYHPDRVQHLGREFREMAAGKAVAINRAYESIRKERGFS